MRCASCSRDLPSAFPGAELACVCGATTSLPGPRSLRSPGAGPASGAGPYREASALEPIELHLSCPFCSNVCSSALRVCPHCDVRFESVRCARCYTLQTPGAFACARCREPLELEPLLDPTDAPCPRCSAPLEAGSGAGGGEDARVHECPRCGGMFVPRDALADLLCRAESQGPFPEEKRAVAALEQVRYVACPLCHATLNRVNFGKVSGVIVDVCRAHGTWFDAGELTRVIAFAANGGLAKTRAREQQERDETKRRVAVDQVRLVAGHTRHDADERVDEWRRFLRELFVW